MKVKMTALILVILARIAVAYRKFTRKDEDK